ncbi:hypothetical protein R1sor_026230 [Riccia sorocarpa]|uniref:Uncharacterized protein n=1 Tax=Riccia sorocarpa TaxID=122646 RepID=A0ABD3GDM5_9MARC
MDRLVLVQGYRAKIESELTAICQRLLELLNCPLIPSATTEEAKGSSLSSKMPEVIQYHDPEDVESQEESEHVQSQEESEHESASRSSGEHEGVDEELDEVDDEEEEEDPESLDFADLDNIIQTYMEHFIKNADTS